MSGPTILISPLRWGFGHAGRMIPLALELQRRGCEVVFGADPHLLPLIEKELPDIKLIEIRSAPIRYSRLLPQYISIFLQLPVIVFSAIRENVSLRKLAQQIRPSIIISDNRFGFFHRDIFSVYVTHQLRIPFPSSLRFMEPFAAWLHGMIIKRYDLCLIPDYPGPVNLSGRLSHDMKLADNIHYMGPLSRFRSHGPHTQSNAKRERGKWPDRQAVTQVEVNEEPGRQLNTLKEVSEGLDRQIIAQREVHEEITLQQSRYCLILSGPEPQRSILMKKVKDALRGKPLFILTTDPVKESDDDDDGVTYVIRPDIGTMRDMIMGSVMVIARSGYTSVMELTSLGKGAVLIPTPGQPEQEYLGQHLNDRYGFITLSQKKISEIGSLPERYTDNDSLLPEIYTDNEPPLSIGSLPDRCIKDDSSRLSPSESLPDRGNDNESSPLPVGLLPDSNPLLDKAIRLLLDHNKH